MPLQFIDTNEDNMVNFKEFVQLLGLMCKVDYTERLKLFYQLHQPPCLLDTDSFEEDSVASPKSGKALKDFHITYTYFIYLK